MKPRIRPTAFAAMSISLLLSASAFADDEKIFPGSMCQWEITNSVPDNRTGGTLTNSTASTRTATCPLVRDSVNLAPESFSLVVGGNVTSCSLGLRKTDGTPVSIPHQLRENLPGGRYRFVWYSGDQDGPNFTGAAYFLKCSMPAGALIYSYGLGENE